MKTIRQHIKLLARISIGIISLIIVNSILFTHLHPLPNGTFIVHAHPYDKTNKAPSSHHHNDSDLLLLTNLTLLFFFGTLFISLFKKVTVKKQNHILSATYINIPLVNEFGRAPPKARAIIIHI